MTFFIANLRAISPFIGSYLSIFLSSLSSTCTSLYMTCVILASFILSITNLSSFWPNQSSDRITLTVNPARSFPYYCLWHLVYAGTISINIRDLLPLMNIPSYVTMISLLFLFSQFVSHNHNMWGCYICFMLQTYKGMIHYSYLSGTWYNYFSWLVPGRYTSMPQCTVSDQLSLTSSSRC